MAKQPAKKANISVNSIPLEDDIDSFELSVEQEVPVVTAFADAGPRRVVGNYDYGLSMSGKADFAAGQSDATIHGLIGSSGVAQNVDPTGGPASADDPHYDSANSVLESYSISGQVGGAVEFSAQLRGNSALERAIA